LLATDWNTYVRDNFDSIKFGHIVVDTDSARNALSVAEGTMVYQTDTNKVWVYSGAAWIEISDLDYAPSNTVCTSSTRPTSNLFEGQSIYETDTNQMLIYDGASWVAVHDLDNNAALPTTITSANIADNTIVNADVNSAAAIAYSKLNLSNSILNADVATGAAIAYSKLNLTNSVVSGDIVDANVTSAKLATSLRVFLNKTTISSGSSSVSIPVNTFTSDFRNYMIVMDGVTTSDYGAEIRIRGDNTSSSSYYWQSIAYRVGLSSSVLQNSGLPSTGVRVFASETEVSGITYVLTPQITRETEFITHSVTANGGSTRLEYAGGYFSNNTSFTYATVYPASGTFNAGTIITYGLTGA
jgi:hypothetical protein